MSESNEKDNVKTETGDSTAKEKKDPTALAKVFGSKKNRRILIVVAVTAVALCLIVSLGVLVSKNSGANGAIKRVMNVYQTGNAAALVEMTKDCSAGDEGLTVPMTQESCQNMLDGDKAYFDDKLNGAAYKLSYKIMGETELSDSETDELLSPYLKNAESLKNYHGNVLKVNVRLTAKDGKEKADKSKDIYLIKVSEKWTLFCLINSYNY